MLTLFDQHSYTSPLHPSVASLTATATAFSLDSSLQQLCYLSCYATGISALSGCYTAGIAAFKQHPCPLVVFSYHVLLLIMLVPMFNKFNWVVFSALGGQSSALLNFAWCIWDKQVVVSSGITDKRTLIQKLKSFLKRETLWPRLVEKSILPHQLANQGQTDMQKVCLLQRPGQGIFNNFRTISNKKFTIQTY